MELHDLDQASVRAQAKEDPQSGRTTGWTVSARCRCGEGFSASGSDLSEVTDRVVDLINEHIKEKRGGSPAAA